MNTTYAQKSSTIQKAADTKAASVLDSSAQNESLQRKADMANKAAQRAEAPRPNNTGMPDNLKSGIESLSGFSMDDVRVHYNSSKPATVQALAYTQGTDIHVAPGQEKCLPHEAWHVAQQMAGRVSPTTNINGMPVNDNAALEHEADVMGEKAVQCKNISCSKQNKYVNTNFIQRMPRKNSKIFKLFSEIKEGRKIAVFNDDRNQTLKNGTTIEYDNFDDKFDSKENALCEISRIAGALGAETQSSLNVKKNECFYAVISAGYTKKNKEKESSVALEMKYQFIANGMSGYIIEVNRLSNKKNLKDKTTESRMYTSEMSKPESVPSAKNLYSSKHRETEDLLIMDATKREDKMFSERSADAYTKLAGEGARFLCVRRNMGKIKDSTVFFSKKAFYSAQISGVLEGVTFLDLWKSWSASFGKVYNIDDDVIAQCLDDNKLRYTSYEKDGSFSFGAFVKRSDAAEGNRVVLDKQKHATLDNEATVEKELLEEKAAADAKAAADVKAKNKQVTRAQKKAETYKILAMGLLREGKTTNDVVRKYPFLKGFVEIWADEI